MQLLVCCCALAPSLGLRAVPPGKSEKDLDEGLLAWHPDYWEDDPRFPTVSSLGSVPPWGRDFRKDPGSRVLLYPKQKLAFCYIEKNACTQFNALFNRLNGFEGPAVWWRSGMHNFGVSFADVSREKGWRWAVFLRDPLPRYLSAWGSKCVQMEDGGANCLPTGQLSRAEVVGFEKNVLANFEQPGPMMGNPHWALQRDFCGGLGNTSGYDFVGYLWGDVHSQVEAMLELVEAPVSHAEEFFPAGGRRGHSANLQPGVFYRNRTVQKMVMHMYRGDFDLPQIEPRPIRPSPDQ